MKTKMNLGTVLFYTFAVAICLWLIASVVNTIAHNSTDYKYAWWNVFNLATKHKVEVVDFEPLSEKITDSNIEWYVKQNQDTIEADMESVEHMFADSDITVEGEEAEELPYSLDDLEILAHVINGEAGAEYVADETRYYVGSVVLNRVASEYYPNSIEEVVFQYGQYECTWKSSYYEEPPQYCYDIAKDLLENGSVLPSNVLLQANFIQGDSIYAYMDTIYFCTWR